LLRQNTFISSPDFKKKDKIETKSLNTISARFNVSMQQEPGFAARPYLKTRSFRLAGPRSVLVADFLRLFQAYVSAVETVFVRRVA